MCTSGGNVSRILAAILLLGCAPLALAAEDNGPVRQHQPAAAYVPGRILVIWNSTAETHKATKLAAVAKMSGASIASTRQVTPRMQLLKLANASGSASDMMLANLRADPRVKYADYDYRKFPLAVPNDTDFANQWYLQAAQASGIRADAAWDLTQGSTGIIVADVDTGIRYDHPDIARDDDARAALGEIPGSVCANARRL